ncbi:MurR/RpiR family transcriptional regulator [Olsenella sp. YH-ols2217]|uniref:MurR/RpiR family transcriptional regulator n=1 Tax=Kribbibacterium absianum TaxID=3044210 RepID=A0ABT6ZJR4_9ACTN|nr:MULTISPECIES: MurR/RpiR family transcriptional regulator [unclassified Olsenella]MDJ1122439.1 MurR/RpiR family transcriptional regulator [Olsenella sp. YH-ols2216]MDJ1129307.1 MurR/RpiR family transcriptional regulator [Olsenella sp. YH-ols2217]
MATHGTNLRLEEHRRDASPAELAIVDWVLAHRDEAAGLSIQELADATSTSGSTVVRLCRKLGFSGYKGFRDALIYDVAMARQEERAAMGDVVKGDRGAVIVRKVCDKAVRTLEATAQTLDPRTVDACVDLMIASRHICLFGVGASLLVARDLQLKLMRANVDCFCADDWHSQLLYAKNMGIRDLAIAFSYSGRTREVIRCQREAKQHGARTIAVTGSRAQGGDGGLLAWSDLVLTVAATEADVRSGAMASRMAQLQVVDVLFLTYAARDWEGSARIFSENRFVRNGD